MYAYMYIYSRLLHRGLTWVQRGSSCAWNGTPNNEHHLCVYIRVWGLGQPYIRIYTVAQPS